MMLNKEQIDELRLGLPNPIAHGISMALQKVDPSKKCKELMNVMELTTRYMMAIVMSKYSHLPKDSEIEAKCDVDNKSIGNGALFMMGTPMMKYIAMKSSQEDAFVDDIVDWYFDASSRKSWSVSAQVQELQELIAIRNKNSHGQIPSQIAQDYIQRSLLWLWKAQWLRNYQVFVVLTQEPQLNGSVVGMISWLVGDRIEAPVPIQWDNMTLLSKGIYLLHPNQEELLYLGPFVVWKEDPNICVDCVYTWLGWDRGNIAYESSLSTHQMKQKIIHNQQELKWRKWLSYWPLQPHIRMDYNTIDWQRKGWIISDDDSDIVSEYHSEEASSEDSMNHTLISIRKGLWGLLVISGLLFGYMGYDIIQEHWLLTEATSLVNESPLTSQIHLKFTPDLTSQMTVFVDEEVLLQQDGLYTIEYVLDTTETASLKTAAVTLEWDGFACEVQYPQLQLLQESINRTIQVNWNCQGRMKVPMVLIPADNFVMAKADYLEKSNSDEIEHEVKLTRSFWMATTETTQELWTKVMGTMPFDTQCSNCAANNISWFDAIAFANKLSSLEGLPECYVQKQLIGLDCIGYRLPTEAEWEFAARGDSLFAFSGSQSAVSVGIFEFNSQNTVAPVKTLRPNRAKIYDMSGNVAEWCQDWYGAFTDAMQIDPMGPSSGTHKVHRGGHFQSTEENIRISNRDQEFPKQKLSTIGFRVVRTQSP